MQILHAWRAPPGGQAVAYANVRISDDVAVMNIKITDRAGKRGAYAPNANGARVVTFSPELAASIADAAIDYNQGASAHDRHR